MTGSPHSKACALSVIGTLASSGVRPRGALDDVVDLQRPPEFRSASSCSYHAHDLGGGMRLGGACVRLQQARGGARADDPRRSRMCGGRRRGPAQSRATPPVHDRTGLRGPGAATGRLSRAARGADSLSRPLACTPSSPPTACVSAASAVVHDDEEADVLQGAPERGRRGGGCVGARREIRREIDDRDHADDRAASDGFDRASVRSGWGPSVPIR